MDFELYKKEFIREATKVGYTEQNIKRCLDYAQPILLNNLPIIYNTTHFSALVGYKKAYIKKAVIYTPKFYRNFEIFKKDGKKRKISEPLPSLKEIQIWVLENILYQVKISSFAKAYVKKTSLKQNLVFHRNKPIVFKIDLLNFFPSIKTDAIERIFVLLGYSKIVSNLLAKLCCKDDCLPQGAPTSPYLSNIFLRGADDLIGKYCRERKINFTRYADDLTFSGDFDHNELFIYVEKIINGLCLKINSSKTKLMKSGQRQEVTGAVVNEKIQVPFVKRNKLRNTLFYIKKFSIDDHIQKTGIKAKNYLEHLIGQINFILYLNPDDEEFQSYKLFLESLKKAKDKK